MDYLKAKEAAERVVDALKFEAVKMDERAEYEQLLVIVKQECEKRLESSKTLLVFKKPEKVYEFPDLLNGESERSAAREE